MPSLRSLLLVVLFFSSLCPGICEEASVGQVNEWVTNPVSKFKVHSLKVVTKWDEMPLNRRFGDVQTKKYEHLISMVNSGKVKVFFVQVSLKNVSEKHRDVGCSAMFGHNFYLRCTEGDEQGSDNINRFHESMDVDDRIRAQKLENFIKGGLSQKAKIAPNATIEGYLTFVVPEWFEPTTVFTKKDSAMGPGELVVKL
jgi:hypothetical protein